MSYKSSPSFDQVFERISVPFPLFFELVSDHLPFFRTGLNILLSLASRKRDDRPFLRYVLIQLVIEAVSGKRRSIAEDDQFHSRPRYRDIHPAQVVQKPDLSVCIGPHQADKDHVAFLSLEAVYRVNRQKGAERLEKRISFDKTADILDLRFVRRDQAEVDALFQNPVFPDLFHVFFQSAYR